MRAHPLSFARRLAWALKVMVASLAPWLGAWACWSRSTWSLKQGLLVLAMLGAYRPSATDLARAREAVAPWQLLAGDFHCHVSPPDLDRAVSRDLDETVALAQREQLDFVVLTPHLDALFFQDDEYREWAQSALADLAADVAARAGGPLLIPGFEYTDDRRGHLGFSFGDLGALLQALPAERLRQSPGDFVRGWIERGGLVTINHPLVAPVPSAYSIVHQDLSWKAWSKGRLDRADMITANALAQGVEVYNLSAAHLRDRLLLRGKPGSVDDSLARMEKEILAQSRRMVPLGGSDSHDGYLRATTFVLARERSAAGIREAVQAGRVCVRAPQACSFQVRRPGEAWLPVGSALDDVAEVEVRASGRLVRVFQGGTLVASLGDGEVRSLRLEPGQCAVLRAEVDGGASAPIYANCPFALAGRGREAPLWGQETAPPGPVAAGTL